MGHNELLLGEALRGVDRDSVFIQVKFGGQRDPGGAFVGYDASPAAVKNSLAYSLTAARHRLRRPVPARPAGPAGARSRTPSARSPR